MATKLKSLKPAVLDTLSNRVELRRSEFQKIVADSFRGNDDDVRRQLDYLADTTPRIAWGIWWGQDEDRNACGCPLASISTPMAEAEWRQSSLQDATTRPGFTAFDAAMKRRFGRSRGVAEIVED